MVYYLEDIVADEFPDLDVPDFYEELSDKKRCKFLVQTLVDLKSKTLNALIQKYIKEEHIRRVKKRKELEAKGINTCAV